MQARVNVPDERFKWLCNLYKPKSEVPAFLEICDIAGLVKGAAQGEGLGNAFLSHIMAVDGIFHVCRAFDDTGIVHVEDRVDPVEGMFYLCFHTTQLLPREMNNLVLMVLLPRDMICRFRDYSFRASCQGYGEV